MATMAPLKEEPSRPMTDFEVLMAVQVIRSLYKRAMTRAEGTRRKAIDAALQHFGPSDVEQAARGNAVQRAERDYGEAVKRAAVNRHARLTDVRSRAGAWADLVPSAPADVEVSSTP
jgi:hypothetical protein